MSIRWVAAILASTILSTSSAFAANSGGAVDADSLQKVQTQDENTNQQTPPPLKEAE